MYFRFTMPRCFPIRDLLGLREHSLGVTNPVACRCRRSCNRIGLSPAAASDLCEYERRRAKVNR